MSHYYNTDFNLKDQKITINATIKNTVFKLMSNSGIFSKHQVDIGTKILLENITLKSKYKTILDLGCGVGTIGIYTALNLPSSNITMVDINQRAVDITNTNINLNHLKNASCLVSDLYTNIDNQKFDLIITNPPIRCGKDLVFKIYKDTLNHLNPNGALYIVVGKKQGAPSHLKYIQTLYSKVEVVKKELGFWVIFAQA